MACYNLKILNNRQHLHNNRHVSYIRYLISLHIREQINIHYFDRILRWLFISPSDLGNEC